MVYGDNSQHGIVKDNNFYHLDLNFSFTTPQNYKIVNNTDNILAFNKNKEVVIIFDGLINNEKLSLLELAESNYSRSNLNLYKELIIDNKSAIVFEEKRLIKYAGKYYLRKTYLINWENKRVWRFSVLINPELKNKYQKEADKIATSIHELSEEEKIIGRPKFIRIYETQKGDTVKKLANKTAIDKNQLEIFKIMNGLNIKGDQAIPPGTLVKMIVN